MGVLHHEKLKRGEHIEERISLTDAFQEATSKEEKKPEAINLNVSKILKS